MFVSPDTNEQAGNLVDAAQAFLKSAEGTGEELAFVLIVDRNGQWRSVHARDAQQVAGDDHPVTVPRGQFQVAGWFSGHTSPATCVRQVVDGMEQHLRLA